MLETGQDLEAATWRLLYDSPVKSSRTGALYNAHPYPTKINADAIVPYLLTHSKPGDVVFDGFAGYGSTALAAALCSNPSASLRASVEELVPRARWGARTAVVYDISRLGSFIGQTLLSKTDPSRFHEGAEDFIATLRRRIGWMYAAQDPHGDTGAIRHAVWSAFPVCQCGHSESYWDLAVSMNPDAVRRVAICPGCGERMQLGTSVKAVETEYDDLIGREVVVRKRRLAYVYGRTGKYLWSRPPQPSDQELLERMRETSLPASVPVATLGTSETNWGDLYRTGYHTGISHIHQFYTRRNLIAVGTAWELASEYGEMASALRLLVSAYGVTHGTLMSRIVTKRGNSRFVVTGNQSGTLYVSDLPVEKNILLGLIAKRSTLQAAFEAVASLTVDATYVRASSLSTALADKSVDYIFTDPPFGDFIPYGEANSIAEAWLGHATDRKDEVIVSRHQGKPLARYEELLFQFFREANRILKPEGRMTLIFHASHADIWAAIQRAWQRAGYRLLATSILDKVQGSLKQVTTEGSVQGDVVILLEPGQPAQRSATTESISAFDWIRAAELGDGQTLTPKQAFSAYARDCLATNSAVISAAQFYQLLRVAGAAD